MAGNSNRIFRVFEIAEPLLDVKNLKKYFAVRRGILSQPKQFILAVDDVSFSIMKGETLGLVGESGCGKTTVAETILGLTPRTSGEIYFEGGDPDSLNTLERSRNMQIVFQDPYSSLDPRMIIKDIVGEPLRIHRLAKGNQIEERVADLLGKVGLQADTLHRFPHEFSGGQRQRIAIARSLILNPKLLVLDEPTSALDVSVQVRILNLLKDLAHEFELTYLFISHNLAVVRYMANRIAVIYSGKIVESCDTMTLFQQPLHPYTQMLLSRIPIPNPETKMKEVPLAAEPSTSSALNPQIGCKFHPRCPYAMPECKIKEPQLLDTGNEHFVACYLISSNSCL